MINSKTPNVLKGQHNLAQGKRRRSVALGWRTGKTIARAKMSIKKKILFRAKWRTLCFPKMLDCNSVRNNDIALINIFARTVFPLHPLPRVAFRFVPPETLPWADIYCPFRAEKSRLQLLCIKSRRGESGLKHELKCDNISFPLFNGAAFETLRETIHDAQQMTTMTCSSFAISFFVHGSKP